MIIEDLLPEIDKKISDLEGYYRDNQASILTEEDLRCHLFNMFMQMPSLNESINSADNEIKGNKIHAELAWYDAQGTLSFRPDLTILDPDRLSILKNRERHLKLPSKQFSFDGKAVIFELKFCRYKTGITKSFTKKIKDDYEKIKDLFQMHGRDIYCYLVIFSRYNKCCNEFDEFIQKNSDWFKIIYMNSGLE